MKEHINTPNKEENKLKVLMICSFSNSEMRLYLPMSNGKLYNFFRKCFHLPVKGIQCGDIAPWDTNIINNLKGRNDIELNVISAHSGMKKGEASFSSDGVNYWFVRNEVATMLKYVIKSPKLWHIMNPLRYRVQRIVKSINPDIITLVGAENPHISGTILGIKHIPIFVKCQTIYNNPERIKLGTFDEKNAYIERRIFNECQYFSVTTKMHSQMFRQYNKDAYNLKWSFGMTYPTVQPITNKEYDFVNFAAKMTFHKGFHDVIKALGIVKKKYPRVRLNLIGEYTLEILNELQELIRDCGVEENVVFTKFFEKQEDMFQHIQKSRFAVLPCKLDYISGTMSQAMHYGLPLVCYKTDGTPRLNDEKQCVLIAELGNIDDLAEQMIQLMGDSTLAEILCKNSMEYSIKREDNKKKTEELVEDLFAIVDHYYKGRPIPAHLLYEDK